MMMSARPCSHAYEQVAPGRYLPSCLSAVGKVSLGCIEYALCVRVNTWVMSNMLYLNAQGFKLFVTGM